uniref:RBR-type E3 ubiquitin transferase n=1 Tax=Photinus pyralis TaxID=7054 RepID=A0A1Y1JWN5_PHOPY
MISQEYEDSGNETSGDDVDFAMEVEAGAAFTTNEDYQFEVLSTDDIVQYMTDTIKDVNTVVQLPAATTRTLLNFFNWDKEKLLERFYDGNQDELFREAHVVSPFKRVSVTKPKFSRKILGTEECEICFMVLHQSQMTGLECGHRFCYPCWNEYLTTKVMEEGVGKSIACAAHNCPILVDDQSAMRLLNDPQIRVKYQHLITSSFVECNRLLRWCPGPDCNYAIKVAYVDALPVTCRCGHVFCFACGEHWHEPVRCELLRRWIKKCDEDSETSNWIAANTKECPKCNATIVKDGGCNHMVCKNQSCKADFCWVCLGPWEPHGSSWYSCNRYDDHEAKAARDAQDRSRAELQRYLFYCNRYMNHMQSLRFENKLYEEVQAKMDEMQDNNMGWIEVQFLKRAVDILCKCRQTLMYTYVFAYYLRKNNQSVIFEDNQKDLESSTELLSEYLERDITQENLPNIKQEAQDKYMYCNLRRIALLGHVHEGYEKGWWEYTD